MSATSTAESGHAYLDISPLVLAAVQNAAAQVAPASYLQRAAAVALNILSAVQATKGYGETFRILANDACCLVYHVVIFTEQMQRQEVALPLDFENSLKDLFEELREIELFIKKTRCHWILKRFRTTISHSDTSRILEYRLILNHSWARLGLQSNITVRDAVAQIAQRQEAILEVFRRECAALGQQPMIFRDSIHAPNSTFIRIAGNQTNSTSNNTVSNKDSANVTTTYDSRAK